jgi:hypothetical protein
MSGFGKLTLLVRPKGSTPLVPKPTIVHDLQPVILITSTNFIIKIKATLPPNEKNVSVDLRIIQSNGMTEIQCVAFFKKKARVV